MKKSDVMCPSCRAGYRRLELNSHQGTKGEFRCLVCSHLLETLDGSASVAFRLTVQPMMRAQLVALRDQRVGP
jgi:transposase-like protein